MGETENTAAVNLKSLLEKEPQFSRDTPLDNAFKNLFDLIISRVPSLKSYDDLGFEDNQSFVRSLLQQFTKIHTVTREEQRNKPGDLIPVSLHDLWYLEVLVRLIICHGIDANLPRDMRVQACSNEAGFTIPSSHKADLDTLVLVVDTLYPICIEDVKSDDDYIRSVMIKGPLYPEIIVGALALFVSSKSQKYANYTDELEKVQTTYGLFTIYPSLVHSVKDPSAHALLLEKLSSLPVRRPDGVLNLLDFVTGARENEQIDVEKIKRFTQLLVAKPKKMTSIEYFNGLFQQVREQLSFINRPVVITCLNDLITTIYFKNARIIHDFLFKQIYHTLFNDPVRDRSYSELNDTINALISLSKNSSKEVIDALTTGYDANKFYVNLWIYALFLRKNQGVKPLVYDSSGNEIKQETSTYYNVILTLLKSFVVVTGNYDALNTIALNLINFEHPQWRFTIDLETRLASMSIKDKHDKVIKDLALLHEQRPSSVELFDDMNTAVELFIVFLKLIGNSEVTKNFFLNVLSRWVKSSTGQANSFLGDDRVDSALVLIDLKILEQMNKEFTSDIVKKPADVLVVIEELLDYLAKEVQEEEQISLTGEDSDDEADENRTMNENSSHVFGLLMELLSAILDEASNAELWAAKSSLEQIRDKLKSLNDPRYEKYEAKVSRMLLKYLANNDSFSVSYHTDERFNTVMEQLSDPLEPIKVQGLTGLSALIKEGDANVSKSKARNLFLRHLKDPDPFVYLNAVKGLALLCEVDQQETINLLLKMYLNIDGKGKLDDILKIGEVFTRYIQRQNEAFLGSDAEAIVDACLLMIRQQNTLDNRIRMSAISIVGMCLRTNSRGIQSKIPPILDCVFGILQLETETKNKNTHVVRRAAIHLVLDLLWDDGILLLPERYNRSKLITLLDYTKDQDDDPLVREYADDILKELNGRSEIPRTFQN